MSDPADPAGGQPEVLVVSSHVVRGSVGNRSAVFALEAFGFPVWAVPTVTLPWHPGHGPAARIAPSEEEFACLASDIAKAPWTGEIGAILTGYMAGPDQVLAISKLISELKRSNPGLVYLCDPVIGDMDGLYVAKDTAAAIRDMLLPLCDIATPNRYELAWLAGGTVPDSVADTLDLANKLPCGQALVTSSPTDEKETIGNLFVGEMMRFLASHPVLENPPNGAGDLTAALFLCHLLGREEIRSALEMTTASVYDLLRLSVGRGSDELNVETDAAQLQTPEATIKAVEL